MTQRQIQAEGTRQKLIDTARQLIGERGYDNVSVDTIVAACGVAKGTFYHHFKSKDDLTAYLCSVIYDDLEEQLGKHEHDMLEKSLSWFITSWYQDVNTYNLHFARQALRAYTLSAETGVNGADMSHMEKGIELMRRLFETALAEGQLKPDTPIDTLTKALVFSMQGSTIYHCKFADTFDVMGWCDAFLHQVVAPLLKPYRI